jgi:Alcohol dehydrogenase GroES-like domain
MKATLMYEAGDVRVEDVPDAVILAPTDAVVRVVRAAICGSDLHPYRSMPADQQGRRMGHEILGIIEDTGAERIAENFDVFDFELTADEIQALDALDTGVRGGPEPEAIILEAFGRDIPEA